MGGDHRAIDINHIETGVEARGPVQGLQHTPGGGDRGHRAEDRGLPPQDGDVGHPGGAIRDGHGAMRQHLPAVMAPPALLEGRQRVGQSCGEAEGVAEVA